MPARALPPPQQPAASAAAALLAAGHTSGIFSDMTVDGAEIGTLVVIVDRARHLPNLRTMGKQDPYCAARLGKEAKKTDTDRRGGQTPRWDQELRFPVHDGPDYNRLKVSVFNDDKKTDLIGETWVMLDSLLLPGGGQGDSWHSLTCKGRYAGEIRVELTYYDTRPKENRPRAPRQKPAVEEPKRATHTVGPRELPSVKRRPLPTPGKPQEPAQAAAQAVTTDQAPQVVDAPSAPVDNAASAPTSQGQGRGSTRRLSELPASEPPLEEHVSELEPDAYTQHPSALASYASTQTNPYGTQPRVQKRDISPRPHIPQQYHPEDIPSYNAPQHSANHDGQAPPSFDPRAIPSSAEYQDQHPPQQPQQLQQLRQQQLHHVASDPQYYAVENSEAVGRNGVQCEAQDYAEYNTRQAEPSTFVDETRRSSYGRKSHDGFEAALLEPEQRRRSFQVEETQQYIAPEPRHLQQDFRPDAWDNQVQQYAVSQSQHYAMPLEENPAIYKTENVYSDDAHYMQAQNQSAYGERAQAFAQPTTRPQPPAMLLHSNSAPDAVHYEEPAEDIQYESEPQWAPAQSDMHPAYVSPIYEPAHVEQLQQSMNAPAPPPPDHRNSMPAYIRPNPVRPLMQQQNRTLAMHATSAPEELPRAEAAQYSQAVTQPHRVHHATYPGLQHQQQHQYQQRPARYTEPPVSALPPQQSHSIPDFSRTFNDAATNVASSRRPDQHTQTVANQSRYPQPRQGMPRGRPVSMVEPAMGSLHSPSGSDAPPSGVTPPRQLARKSVAGSTGLASGAHYSPDSFNTYNTHSSRPSAVAAVDCSPRELREPAPMYAVSMPAPESSIDEPISPTRTTTDGRILTQSGKVVDPSDHIPSSSWAPEPEVKSNKRPTVAVHIKNRFGPRDARSLNMPQPGSGAAVVGPSPLAGSSMRPKHAAPLVPAVPQPLPQSNNYPGRNRPQMRVPSNPLAESAPGTLNGSYRTPLSLSGPPIPPKLPLGYANGEFAPANEPANDALSQEMSLIDIGPSAERGGGRRRGLFGRRQRNDDMY